MKLGVDGIVWSVIVTSFVGGGVPAGPVLGCWT